MGGIRSPNRTLVLRLGYVDEQVPSQAIFASKRRVALERLSNFLLGAAAGTCQATLSYATDAGDWVAASGTVTIASGSGSIAAIINGVTIPVTWATSDTNTATLLAAAINASTNALVQPFVSASSVLGVVTVTAKAKGVAGNSITLAASGTGATASGARLSGGTETSPVSVTV